MFTDGKSEPRLKGLTGAPRGGTCQVTIDRVGHLFSDPVVNTGTADLVPELPSEPLN